MVAAVLSPTEDQTFDALFGWIALVVDLPDDTSQIIKGFQNLASTPIGSYIVVSPGTMQTQDTNRREYDANVGTYVEERHITYSYQVDCYGELGPTWASVLAVTWRSLWGVEAMISGALIPLYADAPQQLNITNSEGQYEQRYMIRLFGQVNQRVTLPQEFFTEVNVSTLTNANQL